MKLSLREEAFSVHQGIVKLLFQLHVQKPEHRYVSQAFLYYEKGKARSLLDLLEEAKVRVREGIDPASLKEEEKVTLRISRLHRALANPKLSEAQKKRLLATWAEQGKTWQALRVKVAMANPRYAKLTSSQVAGVEQVQAILDKETLLLEYALGEEKSFLWGITQDSMQAYELPVEEAITQLVEQYLSTLRVLLFGKDEIERHIELGRKLYHTLLQPAAEQLQGKSRLITDR